MRKFDTDIACCPNEHRYNEIMYGRRNRYIPFDINYKDIQFFCIKNLMEILAERPRRHSTYSFALTAASETFFPLLNICLDYDKAKGDTQEVSNGIINRLNQEPETLESLANKADEGKKIYFEKMCNGLDSFHHTFFIKDTVPREMNPLIEKFVKALYRILAIDETPSIIPNENQPISKEEQLANKGVFVRTNVVVLKDLIFTDISEISVLMDLLEDRIFDMSMAVFLENCCFDIPRWSLFPLSERNILFKNCHFKGAFRWMGQNETGK